MFDWSPNIEDSSYNVLCAEVVEDTVNGFLALYIWLYIFFLIWIAWMHFLTNFNYWRATHRSLTDRLSHSICSVLTSRVDWWVVFRRNLWKRREKWIKIINCLWILKDKACVAVDLMIRLLQCSRLCFTVVFSMFFVFCWRMRRLQICFTVELVSI